VVGEFAPTGTEGEVRGTVRAASGGSPLDGVTVTATPGEFSTVATGTDGTFVIAVPNGTYNIEAKKTGYVTQSRTGMIVENGVATADFSLAAAPSCGTLPVDAAARDQGGLAPGLASLLPFVLVGIYLGARKRCGWCAVWLRRAPAGAAGFQGRKATR
jgi:hypothetical protein